jgi:PKD repeat protein
MKTTTVRNLLIAVMASATGAFAQQSGLPCGTSDYDQLFRQQHPQETLLYQQGDQELQDAQQSLFQHGEGRTNATYIIPIVFHIIHDYGAEDITDAQVIDEVRILNRDYAKLNPDTANIIPQFQNIASAISIEFRLATIDPEGNCTNGIDRIASKKTNNADDGSKLNPWPRKSYLNVWVVKSIGASGVAGYAYYPSSVQGLGMIYDGVLILSSYIGSIGTGSVTTSRALTHEIGHYLNLSHPWGNTNAPGVACGDDGIPDTPQTKGWDHCPTAATAKICDTAIVENYQNYMDYSYCSIMFTHDQMLAMHSALNLNISDRDHLHSTVNLIATGTYTLTTSNCKPIADFHGNHTFVCEGGTVQFFDNSSNGTVTNRTWTFQGGTPATSTAASPTITYNTAGNYAVTLAVSNSQGGDTILKLSYITVGSSYSSITAPYFESFENPNVLNQGWSVVDYGQDGVHWSQDNITGMTGTSSLKLNNYVNTFGQVDELITPQIDLRYLTGITMSFQAAFASQVMDTSLLKEKLKIYASTSCGQTWTQILSLKGYQLISAGVQPGYFVPVTGDQSQWKMFTVNVPVSYAQARVRFKFEFTGGDYGNEFYFDDLNITGNGVGIPDQGNTTTHVNVFPNPAQGNSNVELSLEQNEHLQITLTDIDGRVIQQIANDDFSAGEHTVPFSTDGIAPGIYFVTIYDGNSKQVRKLSITN